MYGLTQVSTEIQIQQLHKLNEQTFNVLNGIPATGQKVGKKLTLNPSDRKGSYD